MFVFKIKYDARMLIFGILAKNMRHGTTYAFYCESLSELN